MVHVNSRVFIAKVCIEKFIFYYLICSNSDQSLLTTTFPLNFRHDQLNLFSSL